MEAAGDIIILNTDVLYQAISIHNTDILTYSRLRIERVKNFPHAPVDKALLTTRPCAVIRLYTTREKALLHHQESLILERQHRLITFQSFHSFDEVSRNGKEK